MVTPPSPDHYACIANVVRGCSVSLKGRTLVSGEIVTPAWHEDSAKRLIRQPARRKLPIQCAFIAQAHAPTAFMYVVAPRFEWERICADIDVLGPASPMASGHPFSERCDRIASLCGVSGHFVSCCAIGGGGRTSSPIATPALATARAPTRWCGGRCSRRFGTPPATRRGGSPASCASCPSSRAGRTDTAWGGGRVSDRWGWRCPRRMTKQQPS